MMLYFLRHADALPAVDGDDEARLLSPEGEDAMRAAVPTWRRLNLRPAVIVTSPLPRARRTAELLSEGIGAGPPQPDDRLRPGAGWGEMARIIGDLPDARRVLFVGHEPDLSRVVSLLTGAASVRMRTGGLACVEFPGTPEPGAGELAWLVDPDLYADPEPPRV